MPAESTPVVAETAEETAKWEGELRRGARTYSLQPWGMLNERVSGFVGWGCLGQGSCLRGVAQLGVVGESSGGASVRPRDVCRGKRCRAMANTAITTR